MVGLELAVSQVPHLRIVGSLKKISDLKLISHLATYLDIFVPSTRHDDGVGVVGRESHTGDPVRVTLILNSVLALGKGVPQLNRLVA